MAETAEVAIPEVAAPPKPTSGKGYRKPLLGPDEYAAPRIRRERPPNILDWIKKAKPKIDSKEHGTIVFKPWPEQMAVLLKFQEGSIGIIKKGRQIGFTTTLEIAYCYNLIYGEPFHGHYVSSTDEKMMRMLWETRLALKTAILPPGQRDRIVLGTDRQTKITYETPWAANYIHGHAPIPRLEGYPGNSVLLDEATLMPYLEHIQTSFAGMLSDGWRNLWMVGVPKSDGVGNQFFSDFFDKAGQTDSGIWRMRVDWRAHPGRDEKWLRAQLPMFGFREDLRDEAHCCLDILPRDMAFDPDRMEKFAKGHEYVGRQPIPGHNYSLGVDQSGSGACETIGCALDISIKPVQVVELRKFVMNQGHDEGRMAQKAAWIDNLGAEYRGHCLVDSSNEMGTVETVRLPGKIAVAITGQFRVGEDVKDGIRKVTWPRAKLIENAVKLTDMGQVIVDPYKFPELYDAFRTARRWIPGQTRKASGKNVDELDAFLLACIPLTGRGMGVQNGQGGMVISRSQTAKRDNRKLSERRTPWVQSRR